MDRRQIIRKFGRATSVTERRWTAPLVHHRRRSTATPQPLNIGGPKPAHPTSVPPQKTVPPLSVMPTRMLLRALMTTWFLSSPRLMSFSIPIMHRISHSPSWFLNPDRNPILHSIVRGGFYDHFCAGENETQVKETMATMKKMGFDGVILGYARETVVDKGLGFNGTTGTERATEKIVERWKTGTLQTLAMLGSGDFLGIKLTGAGPVAIEAMTKGEAPPPLMLSAMEEICDQASKQNTRVWIDAEQQIFQHAIDTWTIGLMRKYNRGGKVIIYNTLQAYLKGTQQNITRQLSLAQREGWGMGIKLVRGAYIAMEQRDRIHDKIEDTHAAYNGIVQDLLSRKFLGVSEAEEFPQLQLFLASHNAESVKRGYETWKARKEKGLPTVKFEVGQLQGMADEVSCGLVQIRQQMTASDNEISDAEKGYYPRAFKCLCWGSTQECVQFLVRRVVENRGSLDRTKVWMAGLKRELWRRIKRSIGGD